MQSKAFHRFLNIILSIICALLIIAFYLKTHNYSSAYILPTSGQILNYFYGTLTITPLISILCIAIIIKVNGIITSKLKLPSMSKSTLVIPVIVIALSIQTSVFIMLYQVITANQAATEFNEFQPEIVILEETLQNEPDFDRSKSLSYKMRYMITTDTNSYLHNQDITFTPSLILPILRSNTNFGADGSPLPIESIPLQLSQEYVYVQRLNISTINNTDIEMSSPPYFSVTFTNNKFIQTRAEVQSTLDWSQLTEDYEQ